MSTPANHAHYVRALRAARRSTRTRISRMPVRILLPRLKDLDPLQAYRLAVDDAQATLVARLDEMIAEAEVLGTMPRGDGPAKFVAAVPARRQGRTLLARKTSAVGKTEARALARDVVKAGGTD